MSKKSIGAESVAHVKNIEESIDKLKSIRDTLSHLSSDGIDAVMTQEGALLIGDAHSSVTQSEARYRHLINRISALVVELTPTGKIIYLNNAISDITGFSSEDWIGRDWFDLLLPLIESTSPEELREQFLDSGELKAFRTSIRTLDRPQKILSWDSAYVHDAKGIIGRLIFFGTDVTEQALAEQELRIAAIAFESQTGMIVTDPNGIIVRVNKAFTSLTGFSAEESIGQTPHLLSSGRHNKAFYRDMWKTLLKKGDWQGEIWNRRKNGNIYAEWLTISAVITSDGTVTNYVGTFSDITDNKEAQAEIHRLAYYDPLTKLPNRRLLQDRLGQALASSSRNALYGAFMFMDLDHFKTLNDTRGHDAGDQLLIEVTQRMRAVVREGDTLARIGGDEFVVLLEDLNKDAEAAATLAEQVGEKLLDVLSRPYILKGFEFHCSASIGIGLYCKGETVEELFKNADLAMYQAKNAGRNALRFFDPDMQEKLSSRATLENDLRHALEENQFRLYFQPQVNLSRQIIGAEALIRWQHPKRGLVSPVDFIPMAEETGLILPIGQWVLNTACEQIKAWESSAHCQHLQIAINVSARQFRQYDFAEQVRQALQSHAINPERLKLELTESLLLDNIDDTIGKMKELGRIGMRFSMDDFGTGYSSLSYLTQLPLAQLKIDQSFVRNIGVNPSDAVIIQTIIGMANNLGISVIAEGVETEQQRDFLEQHGCPLYQGYFFGKPVPIEEFEALLK